MNSLVFSSNSMLDNFGRVFFKDDKVYRAITENFVDECKKLLNMPFFVDLEERGLIPKTNVTDFSIDGYPLVLEHEKLLNILQHEWTFSMLKDASQMILEINQICEKHGYELKDAHTLNVLFRGGQPVYVDIGSFQKKTQPHWIAYFEYVSCFVVPLLFWSEGKFYITRKLLESNFYRMQTIPEQNILSSGLFKCLSTNLIHYELSFRRKILFKSDYKVFIFDIAVNFLSDIVFFFKKKRLASLNYSLNYKSISFVKELLPRVSFPHVDSLWKNYHNKYYCQANEGEALISSRFRRILSLVKEKCNQEAISSLLDLAGNEGLVSFLIEKNTPIPRITLADYDENALEKACLTRKSENSGINIVLLNFMFTLDQESTAKRFKSDIVLALAVTHHLILTSNFLLSTIFERIKSYSNKYVFIEFMPKGLWSIESEDSPEIPIWYSLEWFKQEFIKHFTLEIEEQLEGNRILFIGRIIP